MTLATAGDVNRVHAIDQMTARLARRARLPDKVGKTWTDEEEQRLRDEFSGGEPIPLIATKHGRAIRAIEARLERLGLLTMERFCLAGTDHAERDDEANHARKVATAVWFIAFDKLADDIATNARKGINSS
jgi:hypothetical protein